MAVNWSQNLYLPCQNVFGRPVTITPVKSQPGAPAYQARGIYNTVDIDVQTEDGAILSDQRTILDIRLAEYAIHPIQEDLIDIPDDPVSGVPAEGQFDVQDVDDNGGGEYTLTLRRVKSAL